MANTMRAMVLSQPRAPLELMEVEIPSPAAGEILIQVAACAVCRTDLHIVDGELNRPALPLIPGHEIVGRVKEVGHGVTRFKIGDRVGVPWLGGACGHCNYCQTGRENLCDAPTFTGYNRNGGFSQFTTANASYCYGLPDAYSDIEAGPLLCAGLIGYRSLVKAGSAARLGIYGFGAAAHIIAQVARHQGRRVFAFTSPGDRKAQRFALESGAEWAGDSSTPPPVPLDAAILFAPVGSLVPAALSGLRKGGTVVCGGIHMSDIPSFPYELLWGERAIVSVANLTRRDGDEFFSLIEKCPVRVATKAYPLAEANEALSLLRSGQLEGAAVLVP